MRALRSPLPAANGAVLCYHSLTTPDLPSAASVNVPFPAFREQVATVRDDFEIVPLSTLLERQRQGRSLAGLAAITFDDAYASLELLRPLLEREWLPVSVFVVTEAAGRGAPYWWDRLADASAAADVGSWQNFTDAAALPRSLMAQHGPSSPREWPWRDHVVGRCAGRWPREWEAALRTLELESGGRTLHRSMNWDEIAAFARLPGVEIGVHTVTHAALPSLPDDELASEVAQAHRELTDRLDRVIPVLAIPFGLGDLRTVRLAREAGMTHTMSVSRRTVSPTDRRHPIPRFCVSASEQPWKLALRLSGVTERLLGWRGESADYPALPGGG